MPFRNGILARGTAICLTRLVFVHIIRIRQLGGGSTRIQHQIFNCDHKYFLFFLLVA